MKLTILIRINNFISIALAIFVFVMLIVINDLIIAFKEMQGVKPLGQISFIKHLGFTIIPIAIGKILTLSAKMVQKKHQNMSVVLLSIYPSMIFILVCYIVFETW